ncbi:trigger factor [Pseudoflavonifractor capillosus]|uniref:trigger factor n=1 Tax=Pseudoflavonifractor TaxID=1017280 RepID=UPI000B387F62|nr:MULTISPECIES: trigger factor [Pseudoflavonifractor]MBM6695108.1 trigger factor [Pseudoflavonifractor capillosus]OUN96972.1 trigger factor [Pseudoflavonifractor sp. An44]
MNIKSNEKKENSAIELVIEVSAAEFDAAINKVYNKQKKNIMVPGFRKGKVPRKMVEKMYGEQVFFEDAVEEAYPAAYDAALKEAGIVPVAYPKLEIVEVSKDGFTFKALVTVQPEASVKEYKGLVVAKPEVKVTAADVKAEMKPYIDRASRLVSVDRKAKKGDVAVIDFEGFKDGVAFEGGKGENYSLELGSGTFVPGFEEQVIGMKAGEEKDLDITFPENYTADLAGAAVVFKVKVNEVKERQEPALDDEFAKDVSEFDTLDEFKKDLKEKLKARRQQQAERDYEAAVIDALLENLVCDVPEAMVDYRADKMVEEQAMRMQQNGLNFQDYLKYMGLSMDDVRAQAKTAADRAVRTALALDAVAKAEGIEVTQEELDAEVKRLAEQFNVTEEQVREVTNESDMKQDLGSKKALELVKASAKKPAKKKEEAQAETTEAQGE